MYNRKDSYFQKAKTEGYRSRAAYKLLEINKKYRIIKRGYKVLDLGAAPGSWSQVCSKLGAKGIAVDLKSISEIKNVKSIVCDLTKDTCLEKLRGKFNVVLSDMAPSTSGIRKLDQGKSEILAEIALEIAQKFLRKNGAFVVKVFEGAETNELVRKMKKVFAEVKKFKPESSRKESKEVYLVGLEKK